MTEEQLEAARSANNGIQVGSYLGFMSGTSMDGVDAALLATDGVRVVANGPFLSAAYSDALRGQIKAVLGAPDLDHDGNVAQAITEAHVDVAQHLLSSDAAADFMMRFPLMAIGFHGQTVFHHPAQGITTQIGDAAMLRQALKVAVVHDFRTADVRAGGQGAPLAPIYHHALCLDVVKPVAVLNLGGVANLSLILSNDPHEMLAFDCGPGNGLIDDWMLTKTGQAFDENGALASQGKVSQRHVERFMADPFFRQPIPKSLDRMEWSADLVSDLPVEDGAATLTAITAEAVAKGLAISPQRPSQIVVCGGGRKNSTLMQMLQTRLGIPTVACEALGWNGDAVEAQAFAYMAARSLKGLPSSFPGTTGVDAPMTLGRRLDA